MLRAIVVSIWLLFSVHVATADDKKPSYPSFDYETASAHEIKPHRRTIPHEGVGPGFNQLRLTLVVSPTGDVIEATAGGDQNSLIYWPDLQPEVRKWKFTPFEVNGEPVTAEVEEYIDLVPPERLPKTHVVPPVMKQDSMIVITLRRSGCFGSCPSYEVTVSTDGVTFSGGGFVVASGEHRDWVDVDEVRKLARRFIAEDFYSMDSSYRASVTDNPTYELSIAIDGHEKEIEDYVGAWEGMPAVVTELEEAVDTLARTDRWIEGADGLIPSLQQEKFDFQTFNAQVMLKEAASRGMTETVRELLAAGVPLNPLPAPARAESYTEVPFEGVGWLYAASNRPETLQVLIDAKASKNDQADKDLALTGAARSGDVKAVRALIAYGANPNADLSALTITDSGGGMTMQDPGSGSVLTYAAESGNPEMLREILQYHPKLEMQDREGKTALFAAGNYDSRDKDGARVECVRILVQAGADVNARDNRGNTPLHEIFLTDVEEELLKLGADVNARNEDGETPIFTNVDEDSIPLFIKHGADLTIRNKKGETVLEAAKVMGPARQDALRKAMEGMGQP